MRLSEEIRNESYRSEGPRLSKRQAEVLAFVQSCGFAGATRREIADGTGLAINCVCGRVVELRKAGHVSEERMTRVAESGKVNSVLVAKEFDRGSGHTARIAGDDIKADGAASPRNSGRTEDGDGSTIGREVQGLLFGGGCDPQ